MRCQNFSHEQRRILLENEEEAKIDSQNFSEISPQIKKIASQLLASPHTILIWYRRRQKRIQDGIERKNPLPRKRNFNLRPKLSMSIGERKRTRSIINLILLME